MSEELIDEASDLASQNRAAIDAVGSLIAVGVADSEFTSLCIYAEVMLPRWAILHTQAISDQVIHFLLSAKPSVVLVHVTDPSVQLLKKIKNLSAQMPVIIKTDEITPSLAELESSNVSFVQVPCSYTALHAKIVDGLKYKSEVLPPPLAAQKQGLISVWKNKTIQTINFADIVLASRYTSTVTFYTKESEKLQGSNFEQFENLVKTNQLVQITATRYVNPAYIKSMVPAQDGRFVMGLCHPYNSTSVTKSRIAGVKKIWSEWNS